MIIGTSTKGTFSSASTSENNYENNGDNAKVDNMDKKLYTVNEKVYTVSKYNQNIGY